MEINFNTSLQFVFSVEGGFSDNPVDPGGATNLGITLNEYQLWMGKQEKVTVDLLKQLNKSEAAPIYHSNYWQASQCGKMPTGVDLIVFDASVNTGNGRSIRILQSQLNVVVDGIIGPVTFAAIETWQPTDLINALAQARLAFYQSLSTFYEFGDGWTNRINAARSAALGLVAGGWAATG